MGGGKNVPGLTSGFKKNCIEAKCQNTIFFCNSVRTLVSSTISQRCRSMRLFSYYWINPLLEIRPISPLLLYICSNFHFSPQGGDFYTFLHTYANRVFEVQYICQHILRLNTPQINWTYTFSRMLFCIYYFWTVIILGAALGIYCK